ncbi:YlxR family protein [Brachybacterium hainanense]|uniref:YlxR family protein n=1 Tax=Brachybacterium hainanense TaxID=1541174 RepID=A0ABV6RGL9_9MICO
MGHRSQRTPPRRTCVGCRQVALRAQLLRLVREDPLPGAVPRVRVDPSGSAPGRGAWIHPEAQCLDLAIARGGFARSFRSAVDTGHLEGHLEASAPTTSWKR